MSNNIKAFIFDWFGVFYLDAHSTLVEHFPEYKDDLEDLRRQTDYGYLDKDQYIEAIAKIVGTDGVEVEAIITSAHKLNSGLITFINISLKPHYKIGLLSNVGRGWMELFFDEHHLKKEFDGVVLSGEEAMTKPHPYIYELIAERLGVEPETCVMVDDLPENIAGASVLGMKGIVYGSLHDLKIDCERLLKTT